MAIDLKWIIFKKKIILIWMRFKLKMKGITPIYKRLNEMEIEINKLKSMQNDVLEVENKIRLINSIKNECFKKIDKERENRLSQSKAIEKRIVEKVIDNINQGIKAVEILSDKLHVKDENIDKLLFNLREKIFELDQYIDKFNYIENLANSAKEKYNEYLKNLRRDISEFEMSHQITRRIASVETRITELEISHNGSGEKISRSTRTDQD